jgi:UV DNA damage repair endonuclease
MTRTIPSQRRSQNFELEKRRSNASLFMFLNVIANERSERGNLTKTCYLRLPHAPFDFTAFRSPVPAALAQAGRRLHVYLRTMQAMTLASVPSPTAAQNEKYDLGYRTHPGPQSGDWP